MPTASSSHSKGSTIARPTMAPDGLTIVASIASIHGGTATADPRKDGGLSVTVRIPSLAARS
jgi:signal transduction histidine kinase